MLRGFMLVLSINILGSRQNCVHCADDIFKCIFFIENEWIWLKISLNFVPKVQINNIPASIQTMVCRWRGDKPLSEPTMASLLRVPTALEKSLKFRSVSRSWKNHWISWKVLEICKNENIMEKSLNFASVTHGKIIEFWNRHSFD